MLGCNGHEFCFVVATLPWCWESPGVSKGLCEQLSVYNIGSKMEVITANKVYRIPVLHVAPNCLRALWLLAFAGALLSL